MSDKYSTNMMRLYVTLEVPPGLLRGLFRFQRESSRVYCKTCISCLYLWLNVLLGVLVQSWAMEEFQV